MTPSRLVLALLGAALLSACGLRGELERPEPLWGDPPISGPDDPRAEKSESDTRATLPCLAPLLHGAK